jgi:hypothetical protein
MPELVFDLGDRPHFDIEPIMVTVQLPPVGTPLDIKLVFDEACHLPYLVHAFPPTYRRNIYLLEICGFDPVTTSEVHEALKSSQVAHAIQYIDMWIVKMNNYPRTDPEEQRTMLNQVQFAPVDIDPIPEPVACRTVTSLTKPECLKHVGQMARSPFRAEFKCAHFKSYDNMYHTGTWSCPVANKLLPAEAVMLPIHSTYAVKSTSTESLWKLQVRSCSNGARMIEGVHYDQSYAPVAMIDSIRVILNIGNAQGKQVFILDIKNAFQNTIEFDC